MATSSAPQTPTLAETLSYLGHARPFRHAARPRGTARRTRNLRTVLLQERDRERVERERRRVEREEAEAEAIAAATVADAEGDADDSMMDVDSNGAGASAEAPKKVLGDEEDVPTYTSIEAPPSILPQKRYCDITGLEAPYTDPATGLRYHDKSIYEFIKTLNASAVKEYLALRGVNPIVK
ncbi:hypothetical protein M0805_008524 [Coniferiporia weirii]|nr:hypothetical protein M0805_008524 [Coniferiporia weirii]